MKENTNANKSLDLFRQIESTIKRMLDSGQPVSEQLQSTYAQILTQMMSEQQPVEQTDVEPHTTEPEDGNLVHRRVVAKYKNIKKGDFSMLQSKDDFFDDDLYQFLYGGLNLRGVVYGYIPVAEIDRYVSMVEDKAREIGKTDLVKIFRKKCTAKKRQLKELKQAEVEAEKRKKLEREIERRERGQMTEYTNLPSWCTGNKFIDIKFTADDTGIYETVERHGVEIKTLICRTPMLINKDVVPENGYTDTADAKVELMYRDKRGWHRTIISYDILINGTKIKALNAMRIGFEEKNASRVAAFLMSMYEQSVDRNTMPELTSTTHLGWSMDKAKFYPYVSGTEAALDADNQYKKLAASLRPHGDEAEWYEKIKNLRKDGPLMLRFAIAAALVSPMLQFIDIRDGMICNIYGRSGSGKSAVNRAVASIWGDSEGKHTIISTFRDTLNALEFKMGFLKNLPLIMEDGNNGNTDEKEKKKKIQAIIMMAANGYSAGRGTRNLSLRDTNEFTLAVLTNSEQRLTQFCTTNGAINRLLECQAPDECPWTDVEAGEIYTFFKENYGFAGPKFIKILQELGPDQVKEKRAEFAEKLRKASENSGKKSGRHILIASVLMTADNIAAERLFEDHITMSVEDVLGFMDDADQVDQNKRFYDYLVDFVSMNASHFEGMTDMINPGGFWGIYFSNLYAGSSAYIAIVPEKLREIARSKDVDLTLFYKYLRKNSLIETDSEPGRNTKKCDSSFLGKRTNFVKIKLPDLDAEAEAEEKTDNDRKSAGSDAVCGSRVADVHDDETITEEIPFGSDDSSDSKKSPDIPAGEQLFMDAKPEDADVFSGLFS